jgi:membrane-associated phospholipid phosphatase
MNLLQNKRSFKTKRGQLIAAFIVFAVLVTCFLTLAGHVNHRAAQTFDASILNQIRQLSSPGLDGAMVTITHLGDVAFLALLTIALVSLLVYRRSYSRAVFIAVTVAGAALLNVGLKVLFNRSRPDLWDHIVTEISMSFPSGHAMASSALFLGVAVIAWNTKWRYAAIFTGLTFTLLIGFSRLYLGVHYPTDIIGGWLASITWVLIAWLFVLRPQHHRT